MNDLEQRILLAQQDNCELDSLLADYLPYIKKQLSNMTTLGLEYDDMLSLAMLTFVNCVRQYTENRGGFLNFAAVSIKNRLIDEGRKQKRYSSKLVDLESYQDITDYSIEQERMSLSDEIVALSKALAVFNITFTELPSICPKQDRARNQCIELQILEMLQGGEKCACVLLEQLKITQPTLSHHMKILTESGVVSARKDGKWTYYSISDKGSQIAHDLLAKLLERFEICDCGGDFRCK